ncbi:MAG: prepilin-type N-terminal cleavage/methylation domain-containing protein [Elusimicrobiaceae bacterium]|nr:prepilin-type N-terminal cleavage/methylation domain-containing protein [Elusimicrobiaceae bacterium]
MKYTRGFTLIELLVVVVILGVLSAIAWPYYQTALWKARFATLWALGKQVSQQVEFYALEQGTYPTDDELAELLPKGFSWNSQEGIYTQGHMQIWCAGASNAYDDDHNKIGPNSCRLLGLNLKDDITESTALFVNPHIAKEDSSILHHYGSVCLAFKATSSPHYGLDHAICKGLGGKLVEGDEHLYYL